MEVKKAAAAEDTVGGKERDEWQQFESMDQNCERNGGQSLLHSQVLVLSSRHQHPPLHFRSCNQKPNPNFRFSFFFSVINHGLVSVGLRPQHAPHHQYPRRSHLGRPSLRSFRQSGSWRHRPRSISSEP